MLYALFALAIACPFALCLMPRALAPLDLPALQLTESEARSVLDADRQAVNAAPRSPLALELERQFLEHGEVEARGLEGAEQRMRRLSAMHATYLGLTKEVGQPSALLMRSRAVEKLEAALDLRLPDEQQKGVLGIFANVLEGYHALRDGDELVPHFVVRTLYKARWNIALSLAPDFALTPVEQRAYHGFMALHAENLPEPMRLHELTRYASAGGQDSAEARGVLCFRHRERVAAIDALQLAYARTGNLHVRNYLLGAKVAAGVTARP